METLPELKIQLDLEQQTIQQQANLHIEQMLVIIDEDFREKRHVYRLLDLSQVTLTENLIAKLKTLFSKYKSIDGETINASIGIIRLPDFLTFSDEAQAPYRSLMSHFPNCDINIHCLGKTSTVAVVDYIRLVSQNKNILALGLEKSNLWKSDLKTIIECIQLVQQISPRLRISLLDNSEEALVQESKNWDEKQKTEYVKMCLLGFQYHTYNWSSKINIPFPLEFSKLQTLLVDLTEEYPSQLKHSHLLLMLFPNLTASENSTLVDIVNQCIIKTEFENKLEMCIENPKEALFLDLRQVALNDALLDKIICLDHSSRSSLQINLPYFLKYTQEVQFRYRKLIATLSCPNIILTIECRGQTEICNDVITYVSMAREKNNINLLTFSNGNLATLDLKLLPDLLSNIQLKNQKLQVHLWSNWSNELQDEAKLWDENKRVAFARIFLGSNCLGLPFKLTFSEAKTLLDEAEKQMFEFSNNEIFQKLMMMPVEPEGQEEFRALVLNVEKAFCFARMLNTFDRDINPAFYHLDLLNIDLTPTIVDKILSALLKIKNNSKNLLIWIPDFLKNSHEIQSLYSKLITEIPRSCTLQVHCSSRGITIDEIRQLVPMVRKNNQKVLLQFCNSKLWNGDLKSLTRLKEEVEKENQEKDSSPIDIDYFSTESVVIKEDAKLWDERQRLNFFRYQLETRYASSPFPLSLDEANTLLTEILSDRNNSTRSFSLFLLAQMTCSMAEEDNRIFRTTSIIKELNLTPKNSYTTVDLPKEFILSVETLQDLKIVCCKIGISEFKIDVSGRSKESLILLIDFLNHNAFRSHSRTKLMFYGSKPNETHHNDANVLYLLDNINNAMFKSLALNDGRSGDVKVKNEEIEALIHTLSTLVRYENVTLGGNRLTSLSPDVRFLMVKKLLQNFQIKQLDLSGNDLWQLDVKALHEICEIASQMPDLKNLILWNKKELMTSAEMNWEDTRKFEFVKIEFRLFGKNRNWPHNFPIHSFSLSVDQQFELINLYLITSVNFQSNSNVEFIGAWVSKVNFTEDQRLALAEKYISSKMSSGMLGKFKLKPKDALKLFLVYWCQEDSEFHNIDHLELYDTSFAFSLFLAPFKQFIINTADLDDEAMSEYYPYLIHESQKIDINNKSEIVWEGIIPELEKACQKIWPTVQGTVPFYAPCLSALKEFAMKGVKKETDILKLWKMTRWFTYVCISLVGDGEKEQKTAKESDNKTASESDRLPLSTASLLKEMIRYAEPSMRYRLANTWLEAVARNPRGQLIYEALLKSTQKSEKGADSKSAAEMDQQNDKNTYKSTLLFASLYLAKILLNLNDGPIASQALLRAKEVLKLIPSIYKEGSRQRPFMSALATIVDDAGIQEIQKLNLIRAVLDTDTKAGNEKQNNAVQSKETLAKKLEILNTMLKKSVSVGEKVISNEALHKILLTIFGNDYQSLLSEKYHNQNGNTSVSDLKSLKRELQSNAVLLLKKKDLQQQKKNLQQQLSSWVLLQGLGLLKELNKVADLTLEQQRSAMFQIFQNRLHINDEQMKFYTETFSGVRCEEAILTYYAKLQSLRTTEGDILLRYYIERFIAATLTRNNAQFFEFRYDTKASKHLASLFKLHPGLVETWKSCRRIETDLDTFISDQNIRPRAILKDYRNFVKSQIFDHQHAGNVEDYPELRAYLEAKDSLERGLVKKELSDRIKLNFTASMNPTEVKSSAENESANQTNLENLRNERNRALRLSLQACLIELIETPENREDLQLTRLHEALRCLSKIGLIPIVTEFVTALKSRIISIKNGKLNAQKTKFPGYKVGITDLAWPLFMCGTDVVDSCQRVFGDATLNKNLLAYVVKGEIKLLYIADENGVTFARCILRTPLDQQASVHLLFVEEYYPHVLPSLLIDAMHRFAIIVATERLGLTVVTGSIGDETLASYPHPLTVLEGLNNTCEYVDALHGSRTAPFDIPVNRMRVLSWSYPHVVRNILNEFFPACTDEAFPFPKDSNFKKPDSNAIVTQIFGFVGDDDIAKGSNSGLHFSWNPKQCILTLDSACKEKAVTKRNSGNGLALI